MHRKAVCDVVGPYLGKVATHAGRQIAAKAAHQRTQEFGDTGGCACLRQAVECMAQPALWHSNFRTRTYPALVNIATQGGGRTNPML